MRLRSKYKIYTQSSASFPKYSKRIFNFRRSKWKKLQSKLLRHQYFLFYSNQKKKRLKQAQPQFFNSFLSKVPYKFWQKLRAHYKKGLQIKNNLRKNFDDSLQYNFFKKTFFSQKNQQLKTVVLLNLVKPLFKIDILLYCLNFYSSSYHARQAINNKTVWVNSKNVLSNHFLKKGDVVAIKAADGFSMSNLLFKKSLHNFFLPFVEIDYYTRTFVVVKDLKEISFEDLYIVASHYFDFKKLRDYL